MSLGVLVSGNLGYAVLKHLFENYIVTFVMTDKKSSLIIDFCKTNQIAFFKGNPRNKMAFDFFSKQKIEVLLSVNYLFLIEKDLIQLPIKIAFNIHGSLLPKFRGRTPHVWAIINNEKQTGISAHLIDEGCDTGHIIDQVIVKISESDTGNDLLKKYNKLYIPLIDNILLGVINNNLTFTPQNNKLATFFGKRTSQDGKINWGWHKERIRNWVRAQAYPYPGAFTFYNKEKVIIDEIEFIDFGYNQEVNNGTILSAFPPIIKTPNGSVLLKKTRNKILNLEILKAFE
jgi:methionyl-tRNA formyltransferase